jgi:hypothetical protein
MPICLQKNGLFPRVRRKRRAAQLPAGVPPLRNLQSPGPHGQCHTERLGATCPGPTPHMTKPRTAGTASLAHPRRTEEPSTVSTSAVSSSPCSSLRHSQLDPDPHAIERSTLTTLLARFTSPIPTPNTSPFRPATLSTPFCSKPNSFPPFLSQH